VKMYSVRIKKWTRTTSLHSAALKECFANRR